MESQNIVFSVSAWPVALSHVDSGGFTLRIPNAGVVWADGQLTVLNHEGSVLSKPVFQ